MKSTVPAGSSPPLRDFVWTLVRTDFKARYHGAASGFVWALLKPLAMFLVLFAVFSFLFRDRTYLWNLLIGLLLWDFFAEGTRVGLESLSAKGYLVTKASFPRSIVVVTSLANSLLTLVVFSCAILTMISLHRGLPSPAQIALFLAYLAMYVMMVVGFALGGSVLFLKYRDLNQVWDVVLQAGFFVAPIVYPIGILPEKFHFYLYLWPVTPVMQFSRAVLVDGTLPTPRANLMLLGVALATLTAGALLFRRMAPRAVERL
jgi:lipopolysaccharide transport system permease protein